MPSISGSLALEHLPQGNLFVEAVSPEMAARLECSCLTTVLEGEFLAESAAGTPPKQYNQYVLRDTIWCSRKCLRIV